jgi:hypothetical protein
MHKALAVGHASLLVVNNDNINKGACPLVKKNKK